MGTLIILAHPALHRSRINSHLLKIAEEIVETPILNLYETYPDFDIDVKAEQERLLSASHIILQHPMYWYSMPSLLKEWIDLVFEHGFAYGTDSKHLTGKVITQAISAGGEEETYQPGGFNLFTMDELTRPMQATANFCDMKWQQPYITYGGHVICQEGISNSGQVYKQWLTDIVEASKKGSNE